jgi:hypothetical protein
MLVSSRADLQRTDHSDWVKRYESAVRRAGRTGLLIEQNAVDITWLKRDPTDIWDVNPDRDSNLHATFSANAGTASHLVDNSE